MFSIFDLELLFSFVAVIFSFSAYSIYYKSIFSGETNPHLYSWLLWGLISITICIIQFSDGAGFGVLNTFFVGFLCLGIAFLAYKKGDKNITLSDKIYLLLGIISIVLWIFVDTPLYSVILLIIVDIFGFIPTFRKLFENPYDENVFPYFLSSLGYSFSILSLSNITFITGGYVFLTAIFNLSLYLMVIYRRRLILECN